MIPEDSLGQTRSAGSRANNCCLCARESPLHLCGCQTNTITASFHKNFFFFFKQAQEEPINLANEFQCPKKVNEQDLGGDEVVSSPNLFYCSSDCKTLGTKQPAGVLECQLGWMQEKNLLACHTWVREGQQRPPLSWAPKCECHQGPMAHTVTQQAPEPILSTVLSLNMHLL